MSITLPKPDFSDIAASEIHHFNLYDIFRRKDGIIQLQIYDGYYGELQDGMNIVDTFRILKEQEKCLVLIVSDDNASFSKEAREFVASEATSKIVKADAFVIKSLSLKILMNGYLKFNKPNRLTRFFNSEQAAIAWLQEIK